MRTLLGWLKVILPAAIIFALCRHVWIRHPEAVDALRSGETRVSLIVLAGVVILLAHVLCMLRWHLLMRALRIPIRLRDTLRLGFLAHLLNFVSPGQLGGDLFKAIFVAREQTGLRTEAIGTIVVDRAWGMLGLLIVTATATLITGTEKLNYDVAIAARVVQVGAVVGILGVLVALSPRFSSSAFMRRFVEIPKIGPHIGRLLAALHLYQQQRRVLVAVGVLSLGVHTFMATGAYLTSAALYRHIPTLMEHLVIEPLAGSVSALPLTPGGVGSFEVAFNYLYGAFAPAEAQGQGVIVGIIVHLAVISCASIGVFFYWWNHREVQQLLREAEKSREC
ncbi:MAG: flippase-like domain-containing protein [Planctomycetales bacterium]|nr:flippase-like domain-containing protein [Planctomycetales bacterium]